MVESNVMKEIEDEIKRAKGSSEDFEIEVVEDPVQEAAEEAKDVAEEKQQAKPEQEEDDYGPKVQKRIQKLVSQRRDAEIQSRQIQEQNAQLQKRLERLEQGSQQSAEQLFNDRYSQTKQALHKAVEEGDTEAQVNFQEQMADMRAAMRIAEMQKQQQQQRAVSPTVGRAQQAVQNPAPQKAMSWWQKNNWFNAAGFERETAAARAIDVQLDLEGYDKNSDDYYDHLDSRLQKVFPELSSGSSPSRPRAKSRPPVAPTTGGSSNYKGNRVRMSQEQLKMARELGITDEKGLKQYEAEIRRQKGAR
jgi:Na+-translocating ferredoxin:NAD+ oxidoreductase RNF subunit RnfB